MSDLVVLGFEKAGSADAVLTELRALQKEHLIDLEDACVVVREGEGHPQVKQAVNLVGVGAATGGGWGLLWGTLVGILFLNPLAGMVTGAVAGASAGALSGALSDYGINDEFIKELGETLTPGSSALFVLVRSATPDKVIDEIRSFEPKVLKTSLSGEDEKRLKDALAGVAAA